MIAHAVASGDAINSGVWLGDLSGDSALSFWAGPKQDFAGVPTLVALWNEPLILNLAVICAAYVHSNIYDARTKMQCCRDDHRNQRLAFAYPTLLRAVRMVFRGVTPNL